MTPNRECDLCGAPGATEESFDADLTIRGIPAKVTDMRMWKCPSCKAEYATEQQLDHNRARALHAIGHTPESIHALDAIRL